MPMASSFVSFFSGLLAPSLLSLSPLQFILRFLRDQDAVRFCRVNKEHQTIYARMRLIEPHTLTADDWKRIEARGGPLITAVQLYNLNGLFLIPRSLRDHLRSIIYRFINGRINQRLLPPALEELRAMDAIDFRGNELPALPATLKKFALGWKLRLGVRGEILPPRTHNSDVGVLTRILNDARHLTDVALIVWDSTIISVLPDTVEKLSLEMCTDTMPKTWPASLTHLVFTLYSGSILWGINIGAFKIPNSLVSLVMPCEGRYTHYDEVLQSLTPDSSLERIQFGPGISDCSSDLFALLPRHVTHVGYEGQVESSHHLRVESLPDTVKYLSFPLFGHLLTRWPAQLTQLSRPSWWRQDLSNLPDSVTILELPDSRWPHSKFFTSA